MSQHGKKHGNNMSQHVTTWQNNVTTWQKHDKNMSHDKNMTTTCQYNKTQYMKSNTS